jgi:menaquinone reductase, iron-sulfur cluster-binding subunit
VKKEHQTGKSRYVMVIDLDRCTGCGDCMVGCAVENNISVPPPEAQENRGLTWMKVYRVSNEKPFPEQKTVCVPIPCQHCDTAPCSHVCPVTAVQLDEDTGIVGQIPERCMGCRYCMAACPYHARYFNWWKPVWPDGMETTLNPDVSTRMRGVAEKCNFCHGRLDRAKEKAAFEGRRELNPGEYVPACAEACPNGAIRFGDALDPRDPVAELIKKPEAFRLLEKLGTETKVYYLSRHAWVRRIGDSRLEMVRGNEAEPKGVRTHG